MVGDSIGGYRVVDGVVEVVGVHSVDGMVVDMVVNSVDGMVVNAVESHLRCGVGCDGSEYPLLAVVRHTDRVAIQSKV